MGGHGHDRAGPVAGEDVVRDKDRDSFAVDRVDRLGVEGDTGLLAVRGQSLDLGRDAGAGCVRSDLGAALRCGQRGDQGMLRREDHEGRPEQRVRARREDPQLLAAGVMVR